SFKQGDSMSGALEWRTTDTLIAIGDIGRVYSVPVAGLPSARGDGQPVTSMIDLGPGTRIVHSVVASADTRWLLATQRGFGFAVRHGDMMSRQQIGRAHVTLEQGAARLLAVPRCEGRMWLALR